MAALFALQETPRNPRPQEKKGRGSVNINMEYYRVFYQVGKLGSIFLCQDLIRICKLLEELILGAASVTQTVPGRIADSAGSMASTKTVIRDIRIFFHFFIAIPPSKKYDGSLY